MLYEIIGLILVFVFFTFPLWIHGNYKVLLSKSYIDFCREQKRNRKYILANMPVTNEKSIKVCTQHQPFKIDDKHSIICNFNCNGDCKFKGEKYYIQK